MGNVIEQDFGGRHPGSVLRRYILEGGGTAPFSAKRAGGDQGIGVLGRESLEVDMPALLLGAIY